MRYTAKARMLSFDFLPDDVVYDLPPMQALLLAGMIARADNLGRLPGDPPVLLSYLFFPKPPRADASNDDVEGLLTRLCIAVPPIVLWYQVGQSRYVQFVRWSTHQAGLREHNLKSTLPAPNSEGSTPVMEYGQPSLFAAPPAPAVPLDINAMDKVRALVQSAAAQHSMARAAGGFDAGRVQEWAATTGRTISPDSDRDTIKFAHWLWNSGLRNMDALMALLEDRLAHVAENPYAYYAAGKPAREAIVMRFHAGRQVAQHEQVKREDAAFAHTLKGGTA